MRFQTRTAVRACVCGALGGVLSTAVGYFAGQALGATSSVTGLPVTDAAVNGVGDAARAVAVALVGGALGAAGGIAVALRLFRTSRWD